jgi:hypothetical protein
MERRKASALIGRAVLKDVNAVRVPNSYNQMEVFQESTVQLMERWAGRHPQICHNGGHDAIVSLKSLPGTCLLGCL